jgi:transposase-like protein
MNPTISTRKKASGRNRRRRSPEEKTEYLALFEKSGMPVSAFCREHGLCEQTFYYWRKQLGAGHARQGAAKVGFAEVAVAAVSASSNVTVHLNTAVSLELAVGADVAWVGRLVRELRVL